MLRYDFDDDLWVLKYDMRNWGIVLRLWISWYVWKWHENYLMLYDAYVYDTMMNMWNDEMSIAWNEIMNAERKTVWVEVPSAQWNVRPFGWKSHRQLKCKISWVKVPLMSTTKQGKRMKGKHDMIYDVFMTRCTNMYVFKWNISYIYIYIVTTGMHRMIYVEFYAIHTYMTMSLNGTEYMYIITVRLHMIIFMWCYA
jgi:hypothetical protein